MRYRCETRPFCAERARGWFRHHVNESNAKRDGGDWILNGSKHFISGPVMPDFAIVFAATGHDETSRGRAPESRLFG